MTTSLRRKVPLRSRKGLRRGPLRRDSCIRRVSKRIQRKRRAWLRAGDVTAGELREIAWRSGGQCAYCGDEVSSLVCHPTRLRGFDHVVPFSAGGAHTASNIVVCCPECNEGKGSRRLRRAHREELSRGPFQD